MGGRERGKEVEHGREGRRWSMGGRKGGKEGGREGGRDGWRES